MSLRRSASDILADAAQAVAESDRLLTVATELITVKEYAVRYKVSVQTVYTAIRCKRIKHAVERPFTGPRGPVRIRVPRESINTTTSA